MTLPMILPSYDLRFRSRFWSVSMSWSGYKSKSKSGSQSRSGSTSGFKSISSEAVVTFKAQCQIIMNILDE